MEKRPAHEVILKRLERNWVASSEGTLDERDLFARSALTLLAVLEEMIIPEKCLEDVVKRLRRISARPHLEQRTSLEQRPLGLEAGMLDWGMNSLLKRLSGQIERSRARSGSIGEK